MDTAHILRVWTSFSPQPFASVYYSKCLNITTFVQRSKFSGVTIVPQSEPKLHLNAGKTYRCHIETRLLIFHKYYITVLMNFHMIFQKKDSHFNNTQATTFSILLHTPQQTALHLAKIPLYN